MGAGDDVREPSSTGRPGTDSGQRERGEGDDRRERIQTGARGSQAISRRAITDPNYSFVDEVIELGDDERKTTKVHADHFRSMISVGGAIATELALRPVQHEELASGGLIAEALRQIKAGGRLQTDSDQFETRESPPLDFDGSLEVPQELAAAADLLGAREQPPASIPEELSAGSDPREVPQELSASGGPLEVPKALPVGSIPLDIVRTPDVMLPLSAEGKLLEAASSRGSRLAIKMRAVTKPPPNKRQPTVERDPARFDPRSSHASESDRSAASTASESGPSTRDNASESDPSTRSGASETDHPPARMNRIARVSYTESADAFDITVAKRGSDIGLLIVGAVVVIGAIATAMLIL